jgi:hypothetical protein
MGGSIAVLRQAVVPASLILAAMNDEPRARSPVSVVLPFHGTPDEAQTALAALRRMALSAVDELVVVDNTGTGAVPDASDVHVVRAAAQASAYYARNEGAAQARNPWLLFVDADCRPRPDVLDRYFDAPVAPDVGALIGEVEGLSGQDGLVPRYARSRGHLGQEMHWRFPFRPWGVTANLLVRRDAWESVGGFHEGIRSGGDTEFSWRLQDAGWRLDYRPGAIVEHAHRDSIRKLGRQAARYAAGRAWVLRRYPGAMERPKLVRRLARCMAGVLVWTLTGQLERARFKALDGVYVVSESAAYLLSNTPPGVNGGPARARIGVVTTAFPDAEDHAASAAVTALGSDVHVEAAARPTRVDRDLARSIDVAWAEDDGTLRRVSAVLWLAARHPWLALRRALRNRDGPSLLSVAARARRLERAGVSELRAVGGEQAQRDAADIARLIGVATTVRRP